VVVGLRDKLRRLQQATEGELESFELLDESRYYFEPEETYKALFLHWCNCIGESAHNWPEPPELLRKLAQAKDPERALDAVGIANGRHGFLVYDPEVLVNERRLEPRGLVTARDPHTGEWSVVDPYSPGHEAKDLSEQLWAV
jgi:hypothetical protein